jgi:hypothetical protein
MMRIITRPDFDGIVCAVLLFEAEKITEPVRWVEPSEMQRGVIAVNRSDIIANLPFHADCGLWFDHHFTNRTDAAFRGAFKIAPSAAGVIFDYYRGRFSRDFSELVAAADRIDAAELTLDEVVQPEKYDYILLSLTVTDGDSPQESYWNQLVQLLRKYDIRDVMADPEVERRCRSAIEQNARFIDYLKECTRLEGPVAVTDFRPLGRTPSGNRFLVYSLFPESMVNVRIRYEDQNRETVAVSVGHSIFNPHCNVNAGLLLSAFGGGGHRGAASCRFPAANAEEYIARIIDALRNNQDNEK